IVRGGSDCFLKKYMNEKWTNRLESRKKQRKAERKENRKGPKNRSQREQRKERLREASLTVEASLSLPLFLFFLFIFLYFIQIFIIQEHIQSAITRMGLDMAKLSYIYDDFTDGADAENFDKTVFEGDLGRNLSEFGLVKINSAMLKLYAQNYLNIDQINKSCIENGYHGISFDNSVLFDEEDAIHIIVRYQIKIPIKLFGVKDIDMVQRVLLRAWTGYTVMSAYSMEEEENGEGMIVYVTKTGSVYHRNRECSHIKLSVRPVTGIPSELRNENGAKYYPCEKCCTGEKDAFLTYYITSDGTRYHKQRDCPKIKRTVLEVKLSEVSGRAPCKRCGN
ncbi:MAG TPA: hypothetical protein DEP17_07655, partial [Lachnospiraceae bacterium]|nr:hypothetical protein [Lachnospiraceae bacterium]